jgi:rubrerythrin
MSQYPIDARRAILFRAIQIEARNGGVYDSLAQLFQGYDDSVTALFCEMAAEERQHGAQLEQRYRERFGPVPSSNEEPKEVIEAPDLDDAEALVFDSMTIEQALETGVRTEEAAREFYRREASRTSDPELKTVYQELADFEETHVRLLSEKLLQRHGAGGGAAR